MGVKFSQERSRVGRHCTKSFCISKYTALLYKMPGWAVLDLSYEIKMFNKICLKKEERKRAA